MIDHLDHIVLTTRTPSNASTSTPGARHEIRALRRRRMALRFGGQKINLHERGREFHPGRRSLRPHAGYLLHRDGTAEDVIARLVWAGVPIVEGPVARLVGFHDSRASRAGNRLNVSVRVYSQRPVPDPTSTPSCEIFGESGASILLV